MKRVILLLVGLFLLLVLAKAPASLVTLACQQVSGVDCFSPKSSGTLWKGELEALEVVVNQQSIKARHLAWDLDVLSLLTAAPSLSIDAKTNLGNVSSRATYDAGLLILNDASARLDYSFDGFSTQLDGSVSELTLSPELGVVSWQGVFTAQNSSMRLGKGTYSIGALEGELVMRDAQPTVTLTSSGGNVGIEGSCVLSNWRYDCDIILDARDIDTRAIDRVIGMLGKKLAPGIYQLELGGKLQ